MSDRLACRLLVFYVPESHLAQVKEAVFGAGGGRIGGYDCCAWEARGQGQYRPLPGSRPFQGQEGVVEHTAEFRVEVLCKAEEIQAVVAALVAAHPYETPAFFHWPVSTE